MQSEPKKMRAKVEPPNGTKLSSSHRSKPKLEANGHSKIDAGDARKNLSESVRSADKAERATEPRKVAELRRDHHVEKNESRGLDLGH